MPRVLPPHAQQGVGQRLQGPGPELEAPWLASGVLVPVHDWIFRVFKKGLPVQYLQTPLPHPSVPAKPWET